MAGPLYVSDPPELLRRVDLGGLTAIFHVRSGMTHIVAPPAPQILDALGEGPAEPAEVLRRISRSFDVEGPEAVRARLEELRAAGLLSTE